MFCHCRPPPHAASQEDVIPVCRELGIGIVAYSPLGRGMLTGALTSIDDLAENDRRRNMPRFEQEAFEKVRFRTAALDTWLFPCVSCKPINKYHSVSVPTGHMLLCIIGRCFAAAAAAWCLKLLYVLLLYFHSQHLPHVYEYSSPQPTATGCPPPFLQNKALVEKVKAIAERKGITPGQLALAWVNAQGEDVFPIPGTKRVKYLEENVKAVGVRLTAQDLQELEQAMPAHEVSHSEVVLDVIVW